MSTRPLSERHHALAALDTVHEVRVWDAATPGWRTLCCCPRAEDAALVAAAVVSPVGEPFEFSEVWAPSHTPDGPRRVSARFPEPTPDERRDLWRRAVDENYATAYVDLKH